MKAAPHKTEMETESPGAPASAVPACLGGDCLLGGREPRDDPRTLCSGP